MKKITTILLLAFVSVLALTGCQKKNVPTVYVYNWGEYIDPEVIDLFEKETNIKVEYNEFVQNEDMYPVIQTGSVKYDVVCPSDYMIQKMIDEDMLAEINFDNVPNISNIDPVNLKSAEEFDPGNKYSVPYCWGTVGILYNKSMIKGKVDSWEHSLTKNL